MIFLFFACAEEKIEEIEPIPPAGHLKIEEVYYSGSVPTAGIDRYYADQFIQLRNTSEHTLDIGGLGLGDIHGLAGAIRQVDLIDIAAALGHQNMRIIQKIHAPWVGKRGADTFNHRGGKGGCHHHHIKTDDAGIAG